GPRTLGDPLPEGRDLRRLERLPFRGHAFGLFRRRDALDDRALLDVAGLDRGDRLAPLDCQRRRIEAEAAFLLQGAVTRIAPGLQHRLDLPRVIDHVLRPSGGDEHQAKGDEGEYGRGRQIHENSSRRVASINPRSGLILQPGAPITPVYRESRSRVIPRWRARSRPAHSRHRSITTALSRRRTG